MKSFFAICLFFTTHTLLAQNHSLVVKNTGKYYYCAGQELDIEFVTTGVFDTDNEFKVQLSNKSGSNFTDLGISGKSSPIKFRLPDSLSEGSGYKIRVIATRPSLVGIPGNSFQVSRKPIASLSSDQLKYPVNSHEDVYLTLSLSGGAPYEVVMNDNATYNFYDSSPQSISRKPYETTTYQIIKVSNSCGIGEASGAPVAKINESSLKILSLNDFYNFCPGGTIRLSYSANEKLNADNKFKLIITASYPSPYEKIIDIVPDASVENFLSGTLPTDLRYLTSYQVRLQTSSPAATSSIAVLSIPQAVRGKVYSGSDYGTPSIVTDAYGGVPPYVISYSDGTIYSGSNANTLKVPIQTNAFKTVKVSLADQCGNIPLENDVIEVIGPSYMVPDTLPTRVFCNSERMELGLKSNLSFTDKTKFKVKFHKVAEDIIRSNSYDVEARLEGEKLVMVTPDGARGFFKVVVETTNPEFRSTFATGEIELSGKPQSFMELNTEYGTHFLDFYGVTNPTRAVLKINDDEIVLSKNDFQFDEYNNAYSFPVYSTHSSKYTLVSIQNACGISTAPVTLSRVAPDAPARSVQMGNLSKSDYCFEEEITVPFKLEGILGADEEVELFILSTTFGVNDFKIGSSKTSPIKVKLSPYSSGNVRIVLRISNTMVSSEARGIKIAFKPSISLTSGMVAGTPVLKGQRVELKLISSGILPVYYTLNGQTYTIKESLYDPDYSYYQHTTFVFPTKSQKYEITNIRNEACGSGDISQASVQLNVAPATIFFDDFNAPLPGTICANRPVTITYKLYGATKDTRYTAQVSDKDGKNFRDISVIKGGNPITVLFPKDLTEGYYKFRLGVIEDNQTYYSEARSIRIATLGVATLTANDGSGNPTLTEGGAVLKINFTGSGPWDYFLPDIEKKSSYSLFDSETTFTVNPKQKTTFKIWSLENTCGYYERKGEVTVAVPPSIELIRSTPELVCGGQKAQIDFRLIGDYKGDEDLTLFISRDNYYFSGMIEVAKLKLPVNINTLTYTVPDNIPEGNYYLIVKINNQKPSLASLNTIAIKTLPTVTMAGNTVINAGNSTSISLLSDGSKPIYYELTDGTKGIVISGNKEPVGVSPAATTTYALKSVNNACGNGNINGKATVTVNPVAERTISLSPTGNYKLCAGTSMFVYFSTTGTFSASNKFQLQLSDANGENFRNVSGTERDRAPLNFTVPTDITEGRNYRIRVVATDPNTAAGASYESIELGTPPTLAMSLNSPITSIDNSVSVKFDFTGTPPWTVSISDCLNRFFYTNFTTAQNPYVYTFYPKEFFTIRARFFSGGCGDGTIKGSPYLRPTLVTATEKTEDWVINIYPNPASDFLNIHHGFLKKGTIQITGVSGNTILTEDISVTEADSILNVRHLPAGIYLISIEGDNKRKVWKMVKE